MEWLIGIAVVGVVLWWFGCDRGPTGATPPSPAPTSRPAARRGPPGRHAAAGAAVAPIPVADELLRRAVDPDDPDGAFMDGYVAGRLTEGYLARHDARGPTGEHPPRDLLPGGEEEEDYAFDGYEGPRYEAGHADHGPDLGWDSDVDSDDW